MRVALATALALAGAPLVAAAPAWAGGLEVVPVQVGLSRSFPNAIVSLKNDGAEETRYQIELFAWGEGSDGTMQLAPSKDLVVFPALFALKPGEQRNLRVGALAPLFSPVERTYRLFIQELPPAQRPADEVGVRVLTRLGIPVFLAPVTAAAPHPSLEGPTVQAGKLSFSLHNAGNAHVRPTAVQAVARGANGEVVAEKRWEGWYVLAGGSRAYQVPVPAEGCKRVRVVSVDVGLDSSPLKSSLETPHGICSP